MLGDSTTKHGHSSLPLQLLVYFNWHYTVFFFLINICLFTYKAVRLYYPSSYLGWDIVTIFLYLFVDLTRLMLTSKGNKTSTMTPLLLSWVLAAPIIVLHAYYMSLQTYVLRVDLVINALALGFVCCESIISILVYLNFYQAATRF